MSLILEALRKSEAERRRAQAPDLFADPSPLTPRAVATSPRWLPWLLAGMVVLLLAGWLARGLLFSPPQPVAVGAAPGRTGVEPQPQVSSVDSSNMATTPVSPTSAPTPGAVAVQPAATVAPALPTAAVAPVAEELPPTASEPRPAIIASVPEAIDAVVAVSRPESPPATVSAPPSTPSTGATIRLADLGSEERRQLPTLKMSMHLWHAVSAERFVILDGERMGEGDRIGDAVIDEITRDGVLLAWQGRRLKLPIQ